MFERLNRSVRIGPAALVAAVLAIPGVATAQTTGAAPAPTAQGYSVDIEFMRPSFGHGAWNGVDTPMTRAPLAWRYGVLLQYENDPLTCLLYTSPSPRD